MAIKPVLHRIIVKQDVLEEKDKTFQRARAAGLIVESNEREREQAAIDTGTVVSIGPTAFRDFGSDSPIKVGDTVVYARYAGKNIVDPEDEKKYVALNDEDIVAILTTEGA
jgi:co-chaperonin GroES (HSP10)